MSKEARVQRVLAFGLILVFAQVMPARAETPPVPSHGADYVRLRVAERGLLEGYVVSADAEHFVLFTGGNPPKVAVPVSSIVTAERKTTRGHAGKGAAIGAVVVGLPFALLGAASHGLSCDEGGPGCGGGSGAAAALVGGGVGAAFGSAIGGAIGALARTDHWEPYRTGPRTTAVLQVRPRAVGVSVTISF